MAIKSYYNNKSVKARKKTTKAKKRKRIVKNSNVFDSIPSHVLRDILAICFFVSFLVLFLIILGKAGPIGNNISFALGKLLGQGKWILLFLFFLLSCILVFVRHIVFHSTRVLGIIFSFSSSGICDE